MKDIPAEFSQYAPSAANASGLRLLSPVGTSPSKILLSTAKNATQSWSSLTRISSMNTAILSTEIGIQKRIPISFFFLFYFSNEYEAYPKIQINMPLPRLVGGRLSAATSRVFDSPLPQKIYGSIFVHIAQIWQSHKKPLDFLHRVCYTKDTKRKGVSK